MARAFRFVFCPGMIIIGAGRLKMIAPPGFKHWLPGFFDRHAKEPQTSLDCIKAFSASRSLCHFKRAGAGVQIDGAAYVILGD
jgi:hypothetical protein